MRLTPLDIREQQFRRVMRGLDPEEVQQFLAAVASEFETLVASTNELRARVVDLEEKITEYRSMEKALRDTLLTAEKVMGDAKESAQREAALILREAELAAERARGRVTGEMQRLQDDLAGLRRLKDAYVARVRWLLRSHLEVLETNAEEFAAIDGGLGPWGGPGSEPASPPAPAGKPAPPAAPEGRTRAETPARPIAPPPVWTQPPPAVEVLRPAPPPVSERRAHPPEPRGPLGPERGPTAPRPALEPPAVPDAGRFAPPPNDELPVARRTDENRPPLLEPEEWRLVQSAAPGSDVAALDDVLRPVGPDGTYSTPTGAEPPPRVLTADEIAQAARRAERLAAEARAALERHGITPPNPGARTEDRGRDAGPSRP